MTYAESIQQLNAYRAQINELRGKMRSLQSGIESEQVDDYVFSTPEGDVRLSELFGEQDALFVIHNMGAACVYCTLWADGFNGIIDHLENRAAFVLSSPDAPDAQRKFADSRGWRFRMVSHQAASVPPIRLAIFHISVSASFRIGRVEARIIIATTNKGSVKLTL